MLRFRVKTNLPFTWFPPFSLSVAAEFASLCCCCCEFFFFVLFLTNLPTQFLEKEALFWGGNVCFLVCYHLFHFVLKWQGVELGRRLHLRSQKSQTVTRFWLYLFIFKVKKRVKIDRAHLPLVSLALYQRSVTLYECIGADLIELQRLDFAFSYRESTLDLMKGLLLSTYLSNGFNFKANE